jgi:hypothetical protein
MYFMGVLLVELISLGRYSFKPPDVARYPRFKSFNAKTRRCKEKIPKGFHQSAQRCHDEGEATLGNRIKMKSTLKGLNQFPRDVDATLSGLKLFWLVDPR